MTHGIFGAATIAAMLAAQSPAPPETYSFSARSDMVWPNSTHQVNRNGSKERVEIKNDAGDFHLVQLYDFKERRLYTRDLNAKTCTMQAYVSPYAPVQHDPIGGWGEHSREMARNPPKVLRTENVNGIAARVVEEAVPGGQAKFTFWLHEKFGFPVKQAATLPKRGEKVLVEMRQLSYAPSPASLFIAPAECTRVGGVTSATGGRAEATVTASVSGTTQASQEPAAAPAPAGGKVTSVQLRLAPERYSGPCPSPVKLVAEITTDGPAAVWYEFLAGAVRKRGPGEGIMHFKAAGTQSITLDAEYVMTPQVGECILLAAEVKPDGSHGPQTVSSEPVSYNATCK